MSWQHPVGVEPLGGKGAKKTLTPLPTSNLNLQFFGASCCIIVSGVYSFLYSLVHVFNEFRPLDGLFDLYLVFFGVLMFLLDAPLNFKCLIRFKIGVGRFARLLNRLTGKGIWFVFLGCNTFIILYHRTHLPGTSPSTINLVCATVLGGYVTGLGIYAAGVGFLKSRRWDRVRVKFRELGTHGAMQTLDRHKLTSMHGLTETEFLEMCDEVSGIRFDQAESALMFNALTTENSSDLKDDPSGALLTSGNFAEWLEDGVLFNMIPL